ncbi:hypothetical protein ACI750_00365 [Aeromonas caviae]
MSLPIFTWWRSSICSSIDMIV